MIAKNSVFSFEDTNAIAVEIKNVSENGTEIECSYTKKNIVKINSVRMFAFNRSSMMFESIAVYFPDIFSLLTPEGQYLKGRVTVINITQSSTKVVMIFNKLMCIDDTFYRCELRYTNTSLEDKAITSNNMSIWVQGKSNGLFVPLKFHEIWARASEA